MNDDHSWKSPVRLRLKQIEMHFTILVFRVDESKLGRTVAGTSFESRVMNGYVLSKPRSAVSTEKTV